MNIKDILKTGKTAMSFEFFPPKTVKGWNKLFSTIADLHRLNPAYVSVTYGAGGSTRDRTHDLLRRLQMETGMEVVAHLTCAGHTREDIEVILDNYAKSGISNILALRGDIPSDTDSPPGDFFYAAELTHFIRDTHPEMGIGVAGFPEGHPSSTDRLDEIDKLRAKVDAGADYIVTQLFFDNRDFVDFVERCRIAGIQVPIIAGIMPIISKSNMTKMARLAPRTRFPAGLL
ncbi:MAG: methylenetetrahydrofolate reductase [NAD(P)H], partial [spirochete symbiont of Stewartia floridana]